MQGAVLVLICLICAVHGRRVQTSSENLKSVMSADAAAGTSALEESAEAERGEHELFHVESGVENRSKTLSATQAKTGNPFKRLISSWSAWNSALPALDRQSGQSIWSGIAYWPLSMIACATALILAFCCSSWVKRYKTGNECSRSMQGTLAEPLGERLDVKTPKANWTMGSSSLPVLSAILEAWDACQDKEPVSFVLSQDEKLKMGDTQDCASSDALDKGENSDIGEAVESASTVSSVVDDTLPRVAFEPCGISPTLLNYAIAKSLLKYLPAGPRVPGASVWKLRYKPVAHGTSMATLHRMIAGCERTLLIIRDADDHVFGGFAPSPWKVGRRFHGSGEAFVFKFGKLGGGAEPEEVQDLADPVEVKVFPWTQLNHHFMYASQRLLAMGGGDGRYALAIHEGLLRGHSAPTPTFGNPPLSAAPGGEFVLKDMEVWSLE